VCSENGRNFAEQSPPGSARQMYRTPALRFSLDSRLVFSWLDNEETICVIVASVATYQSFERVAAPQLEAWLAATFCEI
jgi:hypothetical protein